MTCYDLRYLHALHISERRSTILSHVIWRSSSESSHPLAQRSSIMNDRNPYDLREKYTRFRILVIGRANAGKTTVLQRVCNTTEDPCIYDENNNNLVSS